MQPLAFVPVVAAVIALASAVAAYLNARLAVIRRRIDVRNQFQGYMLEISKRLVDNPDLMAIYDDHPETSRVRSDRASHGKLVAFAYMLVNTFEVVFAYYADLDDLQRSGDDELSFGGEMSAIERQSLVAWENYFQYCVQHSHLVAAILDAEPADPDQSCFHRTALLHMRRIAARPRRPLPRFPWLVLHEPASR